MSLRSLSNTGRERREEEAQNLPPGASSQTDTLKTERVIIASNHQQDSPPMSHLPERERECVCVCVCLCVSEGGAAASPGGLEIDRAQVQQDVQRKKEDQKCPTPIKLQRCITTREQSILGKQSHQRPGPQGRHLCFGLGLDEPPDPCSPL